MSTSPLVWSLCSSMRKANLSGLGFPAAERGNPFVKFTFFVRKKIFRRKFRDKNAKISQNKIQKKIINYNKIKFLMLSSQNTTSICFAINYSSFNSFECFFREIRTKIFKFFRESFCSLESLIRLHIRNSKQFCYSQ